jgi:hypothetical protein
MLMMICIDAVKLLQKIDATSKLNLAYDHFSVLVGVAAC